MKTKTIKSLLVAVAALGAAVAPVQAKNMEDIRIYINPGHGGWDGGDRHMGTVKHGEANYLDTTGFFETNTNLWKGFATVQRLIDYGFKFDPTLNPFPADFKGYVCNHDLHNIQTNGDDKFRYGAARDMSQGIVMSHVKNGYSRNINEIALEVEANNFDLFLSIHSNAATEGTSTNYPAMFVRGENKTEGVPGSLDIAFALWPYAFANTHSQWSYYSMTNPGYYYDVDFWGGDYAITDHGNGNKVKGYYAVLRHNVPGFLMEGYFHTYRPARHRAMNPDVCAIEGEAYARGIADYLGVEKEKTGSLYGIVRDRHEKFSHTYYTAPSNSPDAYLPVNNADIKLMDASGKVVATYKTDDEYNGAFVFRNLEPGMYTIAVEAEGYLPADEQYCGPFEVKAADTTYPMVWIENKDWTPPAAPEELYPDEVNTPAIRLGDSYNFNAAIVDRELPELEGKTIKRLIAKGNYLYTLAFDAENEPYIYILDANTLDIVSNVNTEGTEGSVSRMGDIQLTADGVLLASAVQLNFSDASQVEPGETMGECNFYKWEKNEAGLPTGAPVKAFSTPASANFFRGVTGFTFAYSGTMAEGMVYLPSYSTYYSRNVWLNVLDIADGEITASRFVNSTRAHMNMDELGDDVTLTVSPLDGNSFIVNSSNVAPMQFSGIDYNMENMADVNYAGREGYFKFAGHSMMAVADTDADGLHSGVALYDISKGIHKANNIQASNTAIEPKSHKSTAAAGRTVVDFDDDGILKSADLDLYTVRGNLFSRFTTKGAEQAKVRGNYAYALSSSKDEDIYTLSFKLTDAAKARVELVPVEEGNAVVTVLPTTELNKGENTVTVDAKTLDLGQYNWRVVVENPAVPQVSNIYYGSFASSGVVIDRNTESDNFGNIYVSRYDAPRAVVGYESDMTELAESPFMQGIWDTGVGASPWRLEVLPTGKLLISDWGDTQGGIYLFDPSNVAAGRSNFFAGTCKSSSGEWIYEGHTIGGSTSTMAAVGTGEDTKLISFQEDWPSDYSLNLVYYPIGTAEQITYEPTQPDAYKTLSAYLKNGNVDFKIHEKGMVFGQVRGSGNNTKGVPVFFITDPEGNILFNSGSDMETLGGGVGLIGLSDDASTFLFQDDGNKIHVCSLTWEPEFSLTELYTFNVLAPGGTNNNSYQSVFDPAGNLYVANRSSIRAFSLPREAVETTTPAKSTDVIDGKMDGIEVIAVDAADNAEAPVRYFNMQGVEMPADNLGTGVYIRQQGTKATKVIVK